MDAAFFARYTVSQLREQSDYWLEYQGRLTHPMRYDASTDRYVQTSWDEAFALIAEHLKALPSPDQAEFYTSGGPATRRRFSTSCSCVPTAPTTSPTARTCVTRPAASPSAKAWGSGKGSVTFNDFEHADAIFVLGQNPAPTTRACSNRCAEAVKRGAQVVCFNPLKERGLERFQHPQHALEMLTNGSEPLNTAFFRPALGGDMAAMRGIASFLLQWEREAQAKGEPAVFDHAFIAEHTDGVEAYLKLLDDCSWEALQAQSGLSLQEIEQAARMYRRAERVIICWAMGITQHHHSVATIQEIVNLQLLRGQPRPPRRRPVPGAWPQQRAGRPHHGHQRPPAGHAARRPGKALSVSRYRARMATTPSRRSTP